MSYYIEIIKHIYEENFDMQYHTIDDASMLTDFSQLIIRTITKTVTHAQL
jgi:hypothetical protein